ncbi:MAG: PD-(D/E)XK nuclease family protein, partial [Thermomonas sp.]
TDKPLSDPQRAPLDAQLARARVGVLGDADAPGESCGEHVAWHDGWPQSAGELAVPGGDHRPRVVLPEPAPLAVHARRHSFSTLTRGEHPRLQEELPASDEAPFDADAGQQDEPQLPSHPGLQALERWKGTAFGNALHAMLEERSFELPMRTQVELVSRALRDSGLRLPASEHEQRQLVDTIAARLQGVLEAEILPGLRLADVPASQWRAEMAFDYVLRDVQVAALRDVCMAHGQPGLMPWLSARRLHGLMTGKIDLVFQHAGRFHVLDWKGNWLGDRVQDYAPRQLGVAMDHHQYRLQALLYTVAVDRYLRQRMPGYRRAEHLGDTLYLYLRAVGLAPMAGVWAHRFDDDLVDAIDRALGATERAA